MPCSPVAHCGKAELLRDRRDTHAIRKILLVRIHKDDRIAQLVGRQRAMQFVARFADTILVVRVDDKDDCVRATKVVFPKPADLVLPADVPARNDGCVAMARSPRSVGMRTRL